MTKFQRITEARRILELGESATTDQIKSNYRKLMARWHPDKCPEDPEKAHEMTRRITEAYQVLMDYCANYRYDFSEAAVRKQRTPQEWWMERFGDHPLWSGEDK